MLLCLSEGCSHSRCIPQLWQHCILLRAAKRSCPGDRSQGPVPCPPLEMDFLPWCWEAARGSCPRATARAQRRGCRWLRPLGRSGCCLRHGGGSCSQWSGEAAGGWEGSCAHPGWEPREGERGAATSPPSSPHRVSRADPGAL